MKNMEQEGKGILTNDGVQVYKEYFQKLIQKKRLDELEKELFSLIDRGKLTWEDVYRHFHFIPGLLNDPSLENVYYCCHAIDEGEESYPLE